MRSRLRETFLGAPFRAAADLAAGGAADTPRFAYLGLPLYVQYGHESGAPAP